MLDNMDVTLPVLVESPDAQSQTSRKTQASARGEPGLGLRGGAGEQIRVLPLVAHLRVC